MSEPTTEEHSSEPTPKKPSAIASLIADLKAGMSGFKHSIQGFTKGGAKSWMKLPIYLVFSPFYALRALFLVRTSTQIMVLGLVVGIALMSYTTSKFLNKAFAPKPVPKEVTEKEEKLQALLKAREELRAKADRIVVMDQFKIHLESDSGNLKEYSIGMFFECDSVETKNFLKTQIVAVREIVSLLAQTKSYKEMITDAGKEDFKEKVLKSINAYLKKKDQKGKVVEAEFGDLLMDAMDA